MSERQLEINCNLGDRVFAPDLLGTSSDSIY